MMEQSEARAGHDHAVVVGCQDDIRVRDGSARLDDVVHARFRGSIDVVPEGDIRVRAECYVIEFLEPFRLLHL